MGLLWHPRNLVAYGLVIATGLVVLRFGVNPWIAAPVGFALITVYCLVLPAMALKDLPQFDRQLYRALAGGRLDGALALWKGAWLLRAFGPPGAMKQRLGQVHAARRAWKLAFQAYHEAMRWSRDPDRWPLLLGYTEAGFQAGEDGAVRQALVQAAKDPRAIVATGFMLVHGLITVDRKPDLAIIELDRWQGIAASESDRALVELAQAELTAAQGRKAQAAKKLEALDVDKIPQTLRPLAPLLLAKLLHFEGKPNEARRLFDEVRKTTASGRALIELADFLEQIGKPPRP